MISHSGVTPLSIRDESLRSICVGPPQPSLQLSLMSCSPNSTWPGPRSLTLSSEDLPALPMSDPNLYLSDLQQPHS